MTITDFDIKVVGDNLLEIFELLSDFSDGDLLDYRDDFQEKIKECLDALEIDERLY
jgi:hypothetical protein